MLGCLRYPHCPYHCQSQICKSSQDSAVQQAAHGLHVPPCIDLKWPPVFTFCVETTASFIFFSHPHLMSEDDDLKWSVFQVYQNQLWLDLGLISAFLNCSEIESQYHIKAYIDSSLKILVINFTPVRWSYIVQNTSGFSLQPLAQEKSQCPQVCKRLYNTDLGLTKTLKWPRLWPCHLHHACL